jgi:hypothetical protein
MKLFPMVCAASVGLVLSANALIAATVSNKGCPTSSTPAKEIGSFATYRRIHIVGVKIDSSFYLAALQAGIPADTITDLIRMFSHKIDFQRDLNPGYAFDAHDSFDVDYGYYYAPDGKPWKAGNIFSAKMTLGSGKQIVISCDNGHAK